MTLEESVRDLVRTDPVVQDRYRHYKQVEADVRIAQARYLPTLDLTTGMGKQFINDRSEYTDLSDLGYVNVKLRGNLNLFNGFGDMHYIDEQEQRLLSAREDLLNTVNLQVYDLIEAYITVLKKKREVELSRENLSNHEESYFKIVDKSQTGAGKASDLYQASSRLALAQSNHMSAVNDLREALVKFEKVYGKDVDIDFFEYGYKVPVVEGNFERFFDLARQNNNAIKVAKHNIEVKRQAYLKDLRYFYPKLDLEVSEEYLTNDDRVEVDQFKATVLFNLSWQLYNGGADMALRRKNLEAMTQENEALREAERQLKEKLLYAWNSFEILDKQRQYLQTHIEYSKDTVDSYAEEFLLGNRQLLNVLDAEREFFTSRKEKNNADYDFELSKFRIMEAVGAFYDYFGLSDTFIHGYYAESGAVDVSDYIYEQNQTLLTTQSAAFVSAGKADDQVYGFGKLSVVSMEDYNSSKQMFMQRTQAIESYEPQPQSAQELSSYYVKPVAEVNATCYCLQIATLSKMDYDLMNKIQSATGSDLFYRDSVRIPGAKVLNAGPFVSIDEAKAVLEKVRLHVKDAFIKKCEECR
ncbi:MAG: TolC family protein [Campylobacterales bacterium]|nr:TolC family protein [Campylobacterales bacterium]